MRERLLGSIIIVLSASMLIWQSVEPTRGKDAIMGEVINTQGGDVFRVRGDREQTLKPGDTIRRGEYIKTRDAFSSLEVDGTIIVLAKRTEIIVVNHSSAQPQIRLLGGRIFTSGDIFVETAWISASSNDQLSVVNYAFDERVQILPLGASTFVENTVIGRLPASLPTQWDERMSELTTDLLPFNPETSHENSFYAWALDQIKND